MIPAIKEVRFIKSSPDSKSCPQEVYPEYAFVGRSNVGKSSLINFLTNRKKLAKTSTQPGRTRLINHFLVDEQWYLVDLPGYGYAKVSKAERKKFLPLIKDYLSSRTSLTCLFLLIDSRHDPQQNDLEFIRWLGENAIPFALCFTKTDKISASQQKQFFEKFRSTMLQDWEYLPAVFFTSTLNNSGREEILHFIDDTNKQLKESAC
ncbi:MAG: YihA family ribosome biogenesis GTP-binding protein [Bacteroidales bacterium]|nr:YihA family ribosome biogenesis GTP-binding protein [Bacteroidales bacterium]